MSARLIDAPSAAHHRDRDVKMDSSSSKRASLDRQTEPVQLKLVSKYYGYANYSYPRPENPPAHNPYRRPGHNYTDQQQHPQQQQQPQPQMRPEASVQTHVSTMSYQTRTSSRNLDRTSLGSDGSAPSLIDDYTDSELSHDDDYQYHTSTSQLWDSFWIAQEYGGSTVHHGDLQSPQLVTPQKQRTEPRARYPALIPSPHIKRAKKRSMINYDEEPLVSRPADPSFPTRRASIDQDPLRRASPPQWPFRPTDPTTQEKRQTIRPVKSSYSLFPKHVAATTTICSTDHVSTPHAPPRTSSLPRSRTPTEATTRQRKTSRPPPLQLYSDPALKSTNSPTLDAPVARPHTSHEMSRARDSTSTEWCAFTPPPTSTHTTTTSSPHVSDPAGVSTTLPMFPSCNLADLTHPRSAPCPPSVAPSAPSRRFPSAEPPLVPTLYHQKSFFDFDSDDDSETEGRSGGGIARMIKGRKQKHGRFGSGSSQTMMAATTTGRGSQEQARHAATERTRKKSRAALVRKSHDNDDARFELQDGRGSSNSNHGETGRKHDVFGRMFGRSRRGSD